MGGVAEQGPSGQMAKERVCVIGSGNWGTAVARIVARNVAARPALYELQVRLWVLEEMIEGKGKLSDVINQQHENVKYLPGVVLPENLVAVPELEATVNSASMLVFVLPAQFVGPVVKKISGLVSAECRAITLVSCVDFNDEVRWV